MEADTNEHGLLIFGEFWNTAEPKYTNLSSTIEHVSWIVIG